MAAKTAQLGSFCGGSSKLVDSAFMGMEESVNMYPETVTATDTYTQKMLKSIEGMSPFVRLQTAHLTIFAASVSPSNSVNEGRPVLFSFNRVNVSRIYEDGTVENFATFKQSDNNNNFYLMPEYGISMCETSGASPYVVICGLFSKSPTTLNNAKRCIYVIPLLTPVHGPNDDNLVLHPLQLPDAFDHEGKISPTSVAYLNYRLVTNDEGHDYIYWSELNKPDGVNDDKAFYQKLTRYAYTQTDSSGTVVKTVTFEDNQYYAPAYGTYDANSLQTEEVWMAALNNVKVDFKADNVKSVMSLDRVFVAFGETSFQVYQWQDSQYCPYITTSKTSSVGLRSRNAASIIDNSIYFLGYGSTGSNAIWKVSESGLERISTKSIEQRLSGVKDQENSFALSYSYKGHSFFVISFCDEQDNFTLCYDITEKEWHTRASLDGNGNLKFWNVKNCVTIYEKVLFNPYSGLGLFYFNKDSFVDVEGNPIPRIRTTGIKFDGGNDIIGHSLELITDNGATKNLELDPRIMLQVSHDGGFTWSSEKWARAGKMGLYNFRTLFDGLGTGSKFAFRVKVTDPAPFNIATAIFTYTPCKNRLF